MGGCVSTADRAGKARSDEIDKQIDEDNKRFKRECKILLLGSGESGKSTIVKQMKIIHKNGFSLSELTEYRPVVYKNVLDSAQQVVLYMRKTGMECVEFANRAAAERILDYRLEGPLVGGGGGAGQHAASSSSSSSQPLAASSSSSPSSSPSSPPGPSTSTSPPSPPHPSPSSSSSSPHAHQQPFFSPEIAESIYSLWKDPIIPKIMDEHSSDFYLMDSAGYFFGEVLRIGARGYVPNETDVLRARQKSVGITETRFSMGQLSIHMFDVGGQRSERKKWIHCFESVTSIIFCTALSEYDQVLLEEKTQNRMAESLVLFESVINSRWFLRTSIILFLNKIDVFKNKLPRVPLERYFPEYTGGADINKAAKYILWKFMQANRARLSVYPHLTQATDTTNIRLVFAAVKETILQNALKDSGIL